MVLGFVGSLHCAGMCGPIAVALPLNNNSWFSRISGSLLYNAGRTITYGVLGIIFGLFGKGLFLGGLQQWVSIGLGASMILAVLVPRLFRRGQWIENLLDRLTYRLKAAFGKFFGIRTYRSLFIIGLLNGFLPCGLVYIALAGAILTGGPFKGATYMVIFGLGTIPMLLALSLAGSMVSNALRNRLRKIIPVFIVILGLLFIVRGMNLGIPYVSPRINKTAEMTTMDCCDKK